MGEESVTLSPVREVVGFGYAGTTAWDVEYELRDIRAFFKEARLSFGAQASLGTLAKERADLLHLALEVRHNPAAPGNASLVLSDSRSADLNVPASLGRCVFLPPAGAHVLSNLAPGDGTTQALVAPVLLSSGTGRVVITTHTPSRKAKKVFSELFYTALLGGADVESALRTVQSEMIRNPEFSSPLVWGTYRVWGR
jgi:CHAT domain-containing protein